MLKKYLPLVLAAGLISSAASFAVAQDNPAPSNDQSQPMQGKGGWHHGPPDPQQRTQELTRKLKLTSDQQSKVLDILQSEKSQMESLRADTATSQQDRRAKMMDIHKNSDSQIRDLLDSTQQKKWDEMQARREQWKGKGGPGGPPPGGDDKPQQ
jgi:periplasmic protein CpxP/Spy